MSTKPREIRKNNDFSLPCPNCDAVSKAKVINLGKKHREVTPEGDTFVFPKGYVALRCRECNLWLLVGLDDDGKPYQSLEEFREIFQQLDEDEKKALKN